MLVRCGFIGCFHGIDPPSGSGKSLCYQVPALASGKIALVICPLISLMHDQVAKLCANGIRATYLASTQKDTDLCAVLSCSGDKTHLFQKISAGDFQVVYLTPKMAVTKTEWVWTSLLDPAVLIWSSSRRYRAPFVCLPLMRHIACQNGPRLPARVSHAWLRP